MSNTLLKEAELNKPPAASAIELKDICFAYKNSSKHPVLNIQQWNVDKGEHVFLQGASGSGKSTLLNVLAGLLMPQTGDVKVLGEALNQLKKSQRDRFRARHIGMIFQQFNLIPWLSVRENISAAHHFAKSSVNSQDMNSRMLELLDLLKLNASIANSVTAELSIGQQQRIAIVRALINEPEIIIADEPTSSLDAENCERFLRLLFDVVEKNAATLIFVSHDRGLAQYFEKVSELQQLNRVETGQ